MEAAWRSVAGHLVARRAQVLGVAVEPDDAWVQTLPAMIPGLIGSLAVEHPDLGIRSVRLVRQSGSRLEG